MTSCLFGHFQSAKLLPAARVTTRGFPMWHSILGDVMSGITGSVALEMTVDYSSGISVLQCSIDQRRYVFRSSYYFSMGQFARLFRC